MNKPRNVGSSDRSVPRGAECLVRCLVAFVFFFFCLKTFRDTNTTGMTCRVINSTWSFAPRSTDCKCLVVLPSFLAFLYCYIWFLFYSRFLFAFYCSSHRCISWFGFHLITNGQRRHESKYLCLLIDSTTANAMIAATLSKTKEPWKNFTKFCILRNETKRNET